MKNRGRGGGRSLHRFEAGFALLLGAGFADPYHAAAHGAQRVLVQDKFDHLSAPQVKMPVEPESLFRGIDHQAGNSCLVPLEIDDQAGRLFAAIRFDRRPSGTGEVVGIEQPLKAKDLGIWIRLLL